ncbi:hypothetical protein Tco_0542837 [Tanacetum coccineum]
MAIPNVPLSEGIGVGGSPRYQEAMGGSIAQTRSKRVPTSSYDSPLLRVNTLGSDEGSMTLLELTVLCTTLSKKVERLEADLKQTKKVYGAAYTKLIKKVKKLEKTVKSNQARRKAKIVVSDDEEDLEDSSKQGRMIEEIDQDARITLVTPTKDTKKMLTLILEEEGQLVLAVEKLVLLVSISIPSPVVVKDKGKGIMIDFEDEQTKRRKLPQEQDRLGHEATVRLQEELDEEERQRMARVHTIHAAAQSFTKEEWENIIARVEADEELTQRLQAEERNKYSEVDQAKMLVDLINQRKRYFVAQKAEAKMNKPMTQAQQRNYMMNYIKHIGSHTLQQLKKYSFDELKELFETTMKNVNTFVSMETEDRRRASELAAGSSQALITDSAEVGSSKRDAEVGLDHEGSKKQKTNEASEVGNHTEVYQIFADMLKKFDRDDLVKLWDLVKERLNNDDTLWKLQRYMHDPLVWRLYDTCGVHHVSSVRGHDIFMLVEKDYPLLKGVQMLMLEKLVDLDDNHKFRGGLLGFKPITLSTARVSTAKRKILPTNSLKTLVSGVNSRSTRASHPLCEIRACGRCCSILKDDGTINVAL